MKKKTLGNIIFTLSSLMLISSCSSKYNYLSKDENQNESFKPEEYNQLFAPNSIDFNLENKYLKWASVSGASYYDIKIQGEDANGKNISKLIENKTNSYYTISNTDFTKYFETGNKVLISVRAKTSNDKETAICSNYISYIYDPTNHTDLAQFNYKLDNENNAIITGFSANCTSSDKKNIEIPQTIAGHKVIKIGDGAFVSDKKYIETVKIPASVEEIGTYAFSSVESSNKSASIKTIEFEEGSNLKKIGEGAFYSLSSLEGTFTIPNSVEIIENNAFYSCPNITGIDIDIENSSLKEIGRYAFYTNTKISTINIPKNLNKIGEYVFQGCNNLKTINFSPNIQIEEIGNYAFAKTSVSSLVLPDSVKIIGDGAFSNCSSLSSFFFTENTLIEEIGNEAFSSCARLRYLSTVKQDVDKKISIDGYEYSAFENYTISISTSSGISNLIVTEYDYSSSKPKETKKESKQIEKMSVVLPANIKSIGNNIFNGCKLIEDFKLPDTSLLSHIGDGAFNGCVELDTFDVSSNLEYVGDDAFKGCKLLNTEQLVFPESLSYISLSSFNGTINTKLENTLVINNILVNYVGESATLNISSLGNVKYISKEVFKKKTILTDVDFTGVEKIYDGAFNGCTNLNAINLSSSTTYIGDDAFNGCKKAELSLDTTNISYIGNNAFKNVNSEATNKFETLNISNSVEYIGESAFEGVASITTINFASDGILKTIGKKAFYGDILIQSLSFPKSLKEIGSESFSLKSTATSALTSISFANDSLLETIGEKAFSNNTNVNTNITLPENVKVIEQKVFEKCGKNSTGFEFIIPTNSKLTTISKYAFSDSGITNINLTDNISLIEDYAFSTCSKLANVSFSSDFYKDSDDFTLNPYVFEKCVELETINLPKNLLIISDYSFKDCSNLETINSLAEDIDVGNNAFSGTKFADSTNELVIFNNVLLSINYFDEEGNPKNYNKDTDKYEYIDLDLSAYNITKINDGAFSYNTKSSASTYSISKYLKSITLPESLETISSETFKNCYYLENVTFTGSKLVTIEDEAFANCISLKEITLPSSLEAIGNKAFYQCSLEDIIIPSNVKSIGNYAFSKNGTIKELYIASPEGWEFTNYSLKTFTLEANSKLESIGSNAFEYNNIESIDLPDKVLSIGSYAFSNSYLLQNIEIYTNYTVGNAILYGSKNISEITVPGNVSFLGLFGGNSNQVPSLLKKVTISDGSTSIANNSFNGCGNIEEIILPNSITSIGSYAFFGCRNLKSLNCSHVETFKEGAFIGCVNLDTITLSDNINEIGKSAFMSTGWLNNIDDEFVNIGTFLIRYNGTNKEVVLPSNIEYVCGGAFAGNNYVEKITLGSNVIKLFNGAFDSCSNLSSLTITSSSMCNIELEIFDTLTNFKIYVNDITAYTDDIYWSLYEEIIYKK